MGILNEFTNGTLTDADPVNENFNQTTIIAAAGVFTLNDGTTAFDTDYVDISFAEGDLSATDKIRVIIVGVDGHTTDNTEWQFEVKDVTSPGILIQDSAASIITGGSTAYKFETYISQDLNTNSTIRATNLLNFGINNTASNTIINVGTLATGDANAITTAWDLRLNFKFVADIGAGDTDLYYTVEVIQGI